MVQSRYLGEYLEIYQKSNRKRNFKEFLVFSKWKIGKNKFHNLRIFQSPQPIKDFDKLRNYYWVKPLILQTFLQKPHRLSLNLIVFKFFLFIRNFPLYKMLLHIVFLISIKSFRFSQALIRYH